MFKLKSSKRGGTLSSSSSVTIRAVLFMILTTALSFMSLIKSDVIEIKVFDLLVAKSKSRFSSFRSAVSSITSRIKLLSPVIPSVSVTNEVPGAKV